MTQPPPIVPGPPELAQGGASSPGAFTLANVLPAAKPRSPRWVAPVVVFLAIMVVGLAALLLVPKLWTTAARPAAASSTRPAKTTPPATTATPEPFDASGILTLIDDAKHWKVGDQCEGAGGYSDIRGGADVVVTGPSGEDLALASLIGGFTKQEGSRVVCNFIFMVLNVPPGKGIYTLTIGHRSSKFAEADMRVEIDLSLGGD